MLVKRVVGRPAPLLQASKLQQQLAQKLMASDYLNFHLTPVKHTLFFLELCLLAIWNSFFLFVTRLLNKCNLTNVKAKDLKIWFKLLCSGKLFSVIMFSFAFCFIQLRTPPEELPPIEGMKSWNNGPSPCWVEKYLYSLV